MAHATITLEHNGTPVEVDVGIAPLIEVLWSRNIETISSCEDIDSSGADFGPVATGSAYVAFPAGPGARRFQQSARLGRAFDPLVATMTTSAKDLVDMDPLDPVNEGVRLGVQTVLFPADRISALTERLKL